MAQPVDPVIAERYGHQETARDGRWRMIPARNARRAPAEADWRESDAVSEDWRGLQPTGERSQTRDQHKVEAGETLFRIAKRYGVTVDTLQRANGISDPTTLRVGQILSIPDKGDVLPAPRVESPAPGELRRGDDGAWREQSQHPRIPRRSSRPPLPQERPDESWREPAPRVPDTSGRRVDMRGLRALAATMRESGRGREGEMPAGYVFFAQLVAADLKVNHMLHSWLDRDTRARRVSEQLDLDIIYGDGPRAHPERFYVPYIRTGPRLARSGKRYALSRAMPPAGNAFVAQLQASLIELHNRAVDLLIERHLASERSRYCEGDCSNAELARALPETKRLLLFNDARETVIHYYHRIILEDFLPRLIGPERTQDIISNGRDVFFPEGFRDGDDGEMKEPFIPYEFALAAYQFTASQFDSGYVMREGRRARRFDPARLAANRPPRKRLRATDLADWRFFVDILPEAPEGFNFALKIDPSVAGSGREWNRRREIPSTAAELLRAGASAQLPHGQQVAEKLLPELRRRGLLYLWQSETARPDDDGQLWRRYVLAPDRATREALGRSGTPLWYYVLQEAEALGGATGFGHDAQAYALSSRATSARYADAGEGRPRRALPAQSDGGHTLGPVGGTIVGEVLIGLAEHYALTTGKGLGFRPPVEASAYGGRQRFGLTRVRASGGDLGERYLLRNLLIDAGASVALD